ncbi:uncharacterized protein LOC114759292 [Neltuma alba]|uniref:uncharacterized protein LOC114759292 n=1 Tax=Neltuma alba TaxID=207710 RepID=UPI0010A42C84|nr:uncharacterized protein LOC114759292 [Prosopis alba]
MGAWVAQAEARARIRRIQRVEAICRGDRLRETVWEEIRVSTGIDVIIGMDWLSANNAILDCKREDGTLPLCTMIVETINSFPWLSATQATKCIQKSCHAYAVFFSISTDKETGIEQIEVVKEFPEVFPREVSSLPTEREIEFSIELVPGTAPIYKAAYRMLPSKLAELKKQIKELLEKRFIRLIVSP